MKQITSLAFIMLFVFGTAFAKDRTSKHVTVKGDNFELTYGQPSKKQGNVVPEHGTPWVTSVDEPLSITLKKGCMFAGRQVNPGTYTLVTIPYSGEWIIYLINDANPTADRITIEKLRAENMLYSDAFINTTDKTVENYTIDAVKDGMQISWGNKNIVISIKPW